MTTEYDEYIDTKYAPFIENVCLKNIIETPDQTILPISFLDIDWYILEVSECLLEKPEDLIVRTNQALKLVDLPNGMSFDDIKIKFEDLPMPDFEMIGAEYLCPFFDNEKVIE